MGLSSTYADGDDLSSDETQIQILAKWHNRHDVTLKTRGFR